MMAIMLLVAAWAGVGRAQSTIDAAEKVRYRRVFAPEDRIGELAPPSVRYLPVPVKEFERLIRYADLAASGPVATASTNITSAVYEGRLVEPGRLAGSARLTVTLNAEKPAMLVLSPCSLALDNVRWKDRSNQQLDVGVVADGESRLLVEKSGVLLFDWSCRGSGTAASGEFELEFPECPLGQLVLTLPNELRPRFDSGVSSAASAGDKETEWIVLLGGGHRVQVGLMEPEVAGTTARQPAVRQTVTYDVTARGLELTAQFTLDVAPPAVKTIEVLLDPDVRIVRARVGEQDMPWTVAKGSGDGPSRVELQLPEAMEGSGRSLRLAGVAPIQRDQSWRLPVVKLANTFWSEGSAALIVHSPLALESLDLTAARQTGVEQLPGDAGGRVYNFQLFDPHAELKVQLAQPRGNVVLRQGVTVDVGAEEIAARLVAEFTAVEESRFVLNASVAQGWIIDSVASAPAGDVIDWDIKSGELQVFLKRAAPDSERMRIEILARSRRAGEEPLAAADLQPVVFENVEVQRSLTLVRARPPFQLNASERELTDLVKPNELTAADADLLASRWEGVLFDALRGSKSLRFSLLRNPVRFAASAEVVAKIKGDTLEESYVLRCAPEGGRIEQLTVHFSHSRSNAPVWSLVGDEQSRPAATRLAGEESADADGGETWLVSLRHARSTPFELRATRVSNLTGETPLSLVALPGSPQHDATLSVMGAVDSNYLVRNRSLDPIPVDRSVAMGGVRAAYRYAAVRDAYAGPQPAIRIVPAGEGVETASAVVWDMQLDSRYGADGSTTHTVALAVKSRGRRTLQLTLPDDCEMETAWIDGRQAPPEALQLVDGRLTLSLPAEQRFCSVAVQLRTDGPALGTVSPIEPPEVHVDLPVLNRDWTVWTPAGFLPFVDSARLSWSQRLFGPLGQMPRSTLVSNVWSGASVDANVRLASDFLRGIDSAFSESDPQTWSELFIAAMNRPGVSAVQRDRIRVDWLALARHGVRPSAAIETRQANSRDPQMPEAFTTSGVLLLACRGGVVITTQAAAAVYPGQVQRVNASLIHRVRPGPLASSLAAERRLPNSRMTLPLRQWAQLKALPASPWQETLLSHTGGWSGVRIHASINSHARATIVAWDSMRMIGWGMFFVTLAWSRWKAREVSLGMVIGVGGLAAFALLCPEEYSPAVSGMLLGLLASILIGMVLPDEPAGNVDRHTDFIVTSSATTIAVVLLMATFAEWSAAQEATSEIADATQAEPSAPAPIHKVFIPIDAEQRPVGGHYLVPEPLYHQLGRLTANVTRQPRGASIERADYLAVMTRSGPDGAPMIGKFTATLEVVAYSSGAVITVPWPRDATIDPDSMRLDGRVIRAQRSDDTIQVKLDKPGRHQWSLDAEPAGDQGDGFRWPTIAHPQARLEILLPEDAPKILLPAANGKVVIDRETGLATAELGPTTRLVIDWPRGAAGSGASEFAIDQLDWLKIRPGGVLVTTRMRIRPLMGGVRTVRIAVDPRLRLSRFADSSLVESVNTIEGPRRVYEVLLSSRVSSATVLEASFLLAGSTGTGQFRLPSLEVLGATATRRNFAVSIDKSLQHQPPNGGDLESLSVGEFLTAWGETNEKPKFAYRVRSDARQWRIATRPAPIQMTLDDSTWWSMSQQATRLRYEARVQVAAGSCFAHRIRVPRGIRVDEVSVHQAGVEKVDRYGINRRGELELLFMAPVDGEHVVVVTGRIDPLSDARTRIPRVQLLDAEHVRRELLVFRSPDVRIELPDGVAFDPTEGASAPEEWGRLAARFAAARPPTESPADVGVVELQPVFVKVVPNAPQVSGDLITTLTRGDDGWRVEVDYQVRMENGLVDFLWLDVPAWLKPEQVDPTIDIALRDSGSDRRQMVVRPRAALDGPFRFSFSARLPDESSQPPDVADIRPAGTGGVNRFLVLPTQDGLNQITWETAGLQPSMLPATAGVTPTPAAAFEIYRIASEEFRAVAKPAHAGARLPQVRLADVGLAWNRDGTSYGVASYDLEPAGLSSIQVRLATGMKLIDAQVAGLPAAIETLSGARVRISLGPRELPQRLVLMFTAPIAWSGSRATLRAPSLRDGRREIDVERTLWTIHGPLAAGKATPLRDNTVEPTYQELLKLRSTASLIDLDTAATSNLSSTQLARWYRPWAERMLLEQAAIARSAAAQRDSSRTDEVDEADSIVAEHGQVARRLGMASTWSSLQSKSPMIDDSADVWEWTHGGGRSATHLMFPGSVDEVSLRYGEWGEASAAGRWLAALLVGLATLGVVVAARRALLPDALRRWSHLIGVLVGLTWYLWLWPAAVGLVVIAISLLTVFLPPLRSHAVSSVGSTVIGVEQLKDL
jgi:hypothetical protein